MATSGKGFGKFLGGLISKKKPSKGSSKFGSSSTGSDESDDDCCYVDPSIVHPTDPVQGRGHIPEYPPPRPSSPKLSPKSQRPHSSIEGMLKSSNQCNITVPKTDHGKSLDSGNRRKLRPPEKLPLQARTLPGHDDYLDPWDSRKSPPVPTPPHSPRRVTNDDYANPFDAKQIERVGTVNYIEPWDSRKEKPDNEIPGARRPSTKSLGVKIPHKDDYSDPWDSKLQASLPLSSLEEDEDYSTPYDTGKDGVFEKICFRQPNSVQVNGSKGQQDDIYDMPYEEQLAAAKIQAKRNQMAPMTKKQTSLELLESQETRQGPQSSDTYDDPWDCRQINRPTALSTIPQSQLPPAKPAHRSVSSPQPTADDYDAPWEWSGNTVQKAFNNRRISVPTEPTKYVNSDIVNPLPKQRSLTALQIADSLPTVSVTPESPKAYQIDPTIPLVNQGWFHGPVKRTEAELLLRGKPDCSYLIRNSESKREDYSLSVRNNSEPMHLKIANKNGRFILGQNSRPYDTIPEMIHHYSMNKLNIKGAEHVKLIYPIIQEAMYFTVEPGT